MITNFAFFEYELCLQLSYYIILAVEYGIIADPKRITDMKKKNGKKTLFSVQFFNQAADSVPSRFQ